MEDGSPLSRHPRHLQQTFPHPSRWRTPEMCERALWPSQQVPAHFSLAIAWMASTSSLLGGQSGPAGGPRRKSTPNSWPRAHRNQSFSMPSRIRSDRRTMPPSAHVRQVAAAALGPPSHVPSLWPVHSVYPWCIATPVAKPIILHRCSARRTIRQDEVQSVSLQQEQTAAGVSEHRTWPG